MMYRVCLYVAIVSAVTVLKTIHADGTVKEVEKKRLQISDTVYTESEISSVDDSDSKKPRKHVRKKEEDLTSEEEISVASRKTENHVKSKEKLNDISFYPRAKNVPDFIAKRLADKRYWERPTRMSRRLQPDLIYPKIITSLATIGNILCLERYSSIGDAQRLLVLHEQVMKKKPCRYSPIIQRYPFICIEGPEGSDAAKCAKQFALQTGGVYLDNPPFELEELRVRFLNHTPILKRCFFTLCNYIIASEAHELLKTQVVVISRYFYSNMANFLSHQRRATGRDLPREGSKAYKWPLDLLQPDLVFYLHTDEATRKKRLFFRKEVIPETFARSMLEIMRRTVNPKAILLDGALEQSVIFNKIHRHMKQMGINVTVI